jgi:predicted ester cyclase
MKISVLLSRTTFAVILSLPLALGGCATLQSGGKPPCACSSSLQERNKAIVRRFNKEFVEEGHLSVYDELVSPTFRSYEMNGEVGDPRASFVFFTQVFRPAFPDLKVIIEDQFAEGDTVITRKTFQGTHRGTFFGVPATNKFVKFSAIDIIKLRDGQYVEHWVVTDVYGLVKQLKPQ